MPPGKVYTSTGRSTRLNSAKGGVTNRPMILAQRKEKGGSARDVRCEALQYICNRGENTYEGFLGIAKEQPRKCKKNIKERKARVFRFIGPHKKQMTAI